MDSWVIRTDSLLGGRPARSTMALAALHGRVTMDGFRRDHGSYSTLPSLERFQFSVALLLIASPCGMTHFQLCTSQVPLTSCFHT